MICCFSIEAFQTNSHHLFAKRLLLPVAYDRTCHCKLRPLVLSPCDDLMCQISGHYPKSLILGLHSLPLNLGFLQRPCRYQLRQFSTMFENNYNGPNLGPNRGSHGTVGITKKYQDILSKTQLLRSSQYGAPRAHFFKKCA